MSRRRSSLAVLAALCCAAAADEPATPIIFLVGREAPLLPKLGGEKPMPLPAAREWLATTAEKFGPMDPVSIRIEDTKDLVAAAHLARIAQQTHRKVSLAIPAGADGEVIELDLAPAGVRLLPTATAASPSPASPSIPNLSPDPRRQEQIQRLQKMR